jgi:hypothetical protein
MAGSKVDALEQRILDHLFKGGATPALTALSTVYVALFTAAPSDSAAGTEVTGSSYARVAVAAAAWTRTGSQIANNAEIAFPAVTSAAYTVVGWALMDALTVGNMLYWGDISPSVTMNVSDVPRFATGALTVNED